MKLSLPFLTLLLAGAFLLRPEASAQVQECGTNLHTQALQARFPELAQQREQLRAQFRQYVHSQPGSESRSTVKIIPVVVHLITETGGGGLTRQEVEQGIALLNDDFRKLNSDTVQVRQEFKSYATDSQIEFRLARLDPQGNCTDGIVRVASPFTNNAPDYNTVKDLTYWPADRYFNIWLVNSISINGSALNGYAQYPWSGPLNTYGVVCRISRFGLSNTNGIRHRTLTHEIGHCLDLMHTFDDGCGTSCAYSGDEVCDTPPADIPDFSCSPNLNSCSNDLTGPSLLSADQKDQFENYMAYGDCRLMFTHGQKARMLAALNYHTFLQDLTSPANAVATGIASPTAQVCAPIPQFSASRTKVCAGTSITFTDHSYNATPDATWTWNWSFPGGTPSASAQQNPVVQYNTPGTYAATLTVANSAGTATHTKTAYLQVFSVTGETAPFAQGFEEPAFPAHPSDPNKDWLIQASTPDTWARTTNAAALGGASLYLPNNLIFFEAINSAISPAINLSGLSGLSLTFDLAYAQAYSGLSDRLKVYLSTDCGQTWALRYNKAGSTLSSMGTQLIPGFVPSQASHWRRETVALGNNFAVANVRLKFEGISGLGNAVFIDNINLSGVMGISELPAGAISLFPNPAEDQVLLQFTLPAPADISYKLTDVTGREVLQTSTGKTQAGPVEIAIPVANLPAGVYVVQVSDGSSIVTRKLVKQ